MARKPTMREVAPLTHAEASRKNIPTAEHQSVMAKEDQDPIEVAWRRRSRDLDPQLVWRGKDVQDWSNLVVQAPPLYIQQKVHPKAPLDDLAPHRQAGARPHRRQGDRPPWRRGDEGVSGMNFSRAPRFFVRGVFGKTTKACSPIGVWFRRRRVGFLTRGTRNRMARNRLSVRFLVWTMLVRDGSPRTVETYTLDSGGI